MARVAELLPAGGCAEKGPGEQRVASRSSGALRGAEVCAINHRVSDTLLNEIQTSG